MLLCTRMGFLDHTGAHFTVIISCIKCTGIQTAWRKVALSMNIQAGVISLGPGDARLYGHLPASALCPQGHLDGVLVWALGWVEVVVVVMVVVFMVMVVFMPLDHRHHVALRPQHGRKVPDHFMLHHGRLAVPLKW